MPQLLLCLIYLSICKQKYAHKENFYSFLHIFFNSREIVEVKITAGVGSFFGGWSKNKDIYLTIYSNINDNETETYGDFESKDDLAGVVIQQKDYVLKFVNRSPNNAQIGIIVGSLKNADYETNLDFPALKLNSDIKYEELSSPFLYAKDENNFMIIFIYIPFFLIFGITLLFYLAKAASACCDVYDW